MNSLFFKCLSLFLLLFLHEKTLYFALVQPNWLIIYIFYWSLTNEKHSILLFFITGLLIDVLDSEFLGFYTLFSLLLGSALTYFKDLFLSTLFLRQVIIFLVINALFLLYIDFMSFINGLNFSPNEKWLSLFTTTLIWFFIQLFIIPLYLKKTGSYEG